MLTPENNTSKNVLLRAYIDPSVDIITKYQNPEKRIYITDQIRKQYGITDNVYLKIVPPYKIKHWDRVIVTPIQSHQLLNGCKHNDAKVDCVDVKSCLWNTCRQHDSIINIPLLNDNYCAFHLECFRKVNSKYFPEWGTVDVKLTKVYIHDYHDLDDNVTEESRTVFKHLEQELNLKKMIKLSLQNNNTLSLSKSYLIYGPRGVGKTELIKKIANDLEIKIVQLTSSKIYSKLFDEDAGTNLLNIFSESVLIQPCLLICDELDVLFPKSDRDNTLIQELTHILKEISNHRIVLIGITSAISQLDPTIRKKFNEEVFIDVPTRKEREQILKKYIDTLPTEDVDIQKLSNKCYGYVPVDIYTIIKMAAFSGITRKETKLRMEDFLNAIKNYKPYSIKESSATMTIPEVPEVSWEDIGGLDEIKNKLEEMIVWPLQHVDAYKRMGIRPPSGILLYGPPGTGKTMVAKAVASASKSNFIAINIPDLIKAEVGESEKTLSQVFRRAILASPCVIFFDEIQAMFGDRRYVGSDQQKLISQLLLEMDNLEQTHYGGVVVIAATNVPQNIDPSLLRPGRIERLMYVGPPDSKARRVIFEKTISKMKVTKEVMENIENFVQRTNNFTGADIVNICHQAGLNALCGSLDTNEITLEHFEKAIKEAIPSVSQELVDFLENWTIKS